MPAASNILPARAQQRRGARLWRIPQLCLAASLVASLASCSGERPVAPVAGVVTCGGQPVSEGTICFYPDQGRQAVGTIGPDGRYTLTTYKPGDGALVGPHRVTIEASRLSQSTLDDADSDFDVPLGGGDFQITWLVPERYSQAATTSLLAEVEDGTNEIDFVIPSPLP